MKSGKVLMKILPMSLSSQSATLRVKWLKGHRCFMSFLIRGGLSGFSVMSRSPGRLSIMSSEQQVWYWVVQGLGGKKKRGGISIAVQLCKSDVEKPRKLAFALWFPWVTCSCNEWAPIDRLEITQLEQLCVRDWFGAFPIPLYLQCTQKGERAFQQHETSHFIFKP